MVINRKPLCGYFLSSIKIYRLKIILILFIKYIKSLSSNLKEFYTYIKDFGIDIISL